MLGGLAFIFPVAVYCLILASLNRRKHPIMVPGTWDFAEVLFACSGFLVFGGPIILSGFHQRFREYWLFGPRRALHGVQDWPFWIGIWALYFLFIIGGSAFLLWRRRLTTAIYNIEPPAFLECLGQVLDHLQLDWTRSENRIFITGRASAEPESVPLNRQIVLELDPFPSLRHLTLHWAADAEPVRTQVESELEHALVHVQTPASPVAAWMLSAAACLFTLMFFSLAFLGLLLMRAQRY